MPEASAPTEAETFPGALEVNLTLGALIALLRQQDQERPVYFDVWGRCLRPTGLNSYRGYYDHLALGFSDESVPPKVSELLQWCENAVGTTYSGWKGGEYMMSYDTPLWVANAGNSTGVALTGVKTHKDWAVVLTTRVTDDANY